MSKIRNTDSGRGVGDVGSARYPMPYHKGFKLQCLVSSHTVIPLFHWDFGSSFTRRKQGLFLLVTYGRLLCHSQMNLICVCWLSGQCLTCLAWSDEVKTVKMADEGTNTPVPQSFLLIVHSLEARFISSDHHRRLSCHSQMNLICVCRLSGQCLACQVWSDEVKMSDEGTKCRA